MELAHHFDDQEQHQGHQQEVDDGGDEGPVHELGVPEAKGQGAEIRAAGDEAQQGIEDVVDQGVDDGGKRTADDNTDGHIYHVAAGDKFLKFLDEAFGAFDQAHGGVFCSFFGIHVWGPPQYIVVFCFNRSIVA